MTGNYYYDFTEKINVKNNFSTRFKSACGVIQQRSFTRNKWFMLDEMIVKMIRIAIPIPISCLKRSNVAFLLHRKRNIFWRCPQKNPLETKQFLLNSSNKTSTQLFVGSSPVISILTYEYKQLLVSFMSDMWYLVNIIIGGKNSFFLF